MKIKIKYSAEECFRSRNWCKNSCPSSTIIWLNVFQLNLSYLRLMFKKAAKSSLKYSNLRNILTSIINSQPLIRFCTSFSTKHNDIINDDSSLTKVSGQYVFVRFFLKSLYLFLKSYQNTFESNLLTKIILFS